MQTFEGSPRAGMVGPMLADAHGLASGSPGLVFEDASAASYLEDAKPDRTSNFLRKADYVPATCAVISKSLFGKIGGFDSQVSCSFAALL